MQSILRIGSLRSPPPIRLRHWTHLRCEGSQSSEGSRVQRVQRVVDCRWRGNKFYNAAKGGRKERSPLPIEPYVAQWKAPIVPPAELGERWWRQPPKGGRFSIARKGGCLVLYKLAPNFFEGAYHGLCPLSEATQPFSITCGASRAPLRPKGAFPLNLLTPLNPGAERRLNPQARQGLSIGRVNLREYWKAPPFEPFNPSSPLTY